MIKTKTTENIIKNFHPNREGVDFSIVIPVYNASNFTKKALDGLTKLPNNYEIIIVDNGSEDKTYSIVNEFIFNRKEDSAFVSYIGYYRNWGFGAGNNRGYDMAVGRNVMFLNNDIRVDGDFKTWPEEMMNFADKGYLVGALGGMLDKKLTFLKEGKHLPQNDYWYLSGWCICASKKTFDKLILNYYRTEEDVINEGKALGPWNEKYFLYYEDGDLTWRAKKIGIPIKEVDIPLHHYSRVTGKMHNMTKWYKESQKLFRKDWVEKYR